MTPAGATSVAPRPGRLRPIRRHGEEAEVRSTLDRHVAVVDWAIPLVVRIHQERGRRAFVRLPGDGRRALR